MPPKRAKAAAQSSSQPVAAVAPPARNTRKRRYSDGSNASSAVSEPAAPGQAPRKRTKKGKQPTPARETEAIVEEEEEIERESAAEQTAISRAVEEIEEVAGNGERHVHFSSAQQGEQTTASHMTPHPRKMTVKRRFTVSPGRDTETHRIKTTRTSLPANLAEDGGNATQIIRELQFSTLRSVLEERIRRLKEHQKSGNAIDSDMLDNLLVLESQGDDVQYPTLPSTLTSKALEVVSTPSKQTPSTLSRFRSLWGRTGTPTQQQQQQQQTEDVTQADIIDNKVRQSLETERRSWDAERGRFQDAILALSREADEARANLRNLTIQLESFGFDEGTSTDFILHHIRESFISVRQLFESELIGSLDEDASFSEIITVLITNLKEFVARLRVQDKELREKDDVITDLSNQVNGLLDLLAQVEVRKSTVEQQWRDLDKTNEEQSRTLEELEEELALLRDEREDLAAQLAERSSRLEVLVVEKTEFEQSIERLSTSLDQYRNEEARLTGLITKMEQEHADTVAAMNREREETVDEYEKRLDAERIQRDEAERVSEELQVTISRLETRVEKIIIERNTLSETLVVVRQERDAQTGATEDVRAELEERDTVIEEHETRISKLEEELDEVNADLEKLRTSLELERVQREKAEQDLDERNAEIETLNDRLRKSGKEANELRLKLHQVQQDHRTDLKKLEDEMAGQDEQFQTDMGAEIERREAADLLAQERAATILELEKRILEVEEERNSLLITKDERIAELDELLIARDTEVQDLNSEIEALDTDLKSAEQRLDSANETHAQELSGLETQITELETVISTHETTILTLTQASADQSASHEQDLSDRDAAISTLRAEVLSLQATITTLESQRANLEQRVSDEAEQMLAYQDRASIEITFLKTSLADQQAKIANVQLKAREADERWAALLAAREEEVRLKEEEFVALETEQESSEETVKSVVKQNGLLRELLRGYVAGAEATFDRLKEELRRAQRVVDEEGDGFVARGEGLLAEVEAMASFEESTSTTTTTTKKKSSEKRSAASSSSAVKKSSAARAVASAAGGGKKKRDFDSGIGLSQPEIEEAE